MVYQWKEGTRFTTDAQTVGERLEAIRRRSDTEIESIQALRPKDVVADARRKSSPLHDCGAFDWNKTSAAAKWNESQAQRLIRSVYVVYQEEPTASDHDEPQTVYVREVENEPDRAVPRYVSPRPRGGGYFPSDVLDQVPESREAMMEDALRQIRAWQARFNMFRGDFPAIFAAIDETANVNV